MILLRITLRKVLRFFLRFHTQPPNCEETLYFFFINSHIVQDLLRIPRKDFLTSGTVGKQHGIMPLPQTKDFPFYFFFFIYKSITYLAQSNRRFSFTDLTLCTQFPFEFKHLCSRKHPTFNLLQIVTREGFTCITSCYFLVTLWIQVLFFLLLFPCLAVSLGTSPLRQNLIGLKERKKKKTFIFCSLTNCYTVRQLHISGNCEFVVVTVVSFDVTVLFFCLRFVLIFRALVWHSWSVFE